MGDRKDCRMDKGREQTMQWSSNSNLVYCARLRSGGQGGGISRERRSAANACANLLKSRDEMSGNVKHLRSPKHILQISP